MEITMPVNQIQGLQHVRQVPHHHAAAPLCPLKQQARVEQSKTWTKLCRYFVTLVTGKLPSPCSYTVLVSSASFKMIFWKLL